jgi:hypothetical protein
LTNLLRMQVLGRLRIRIHSPHVGPGFSMFRIIFCWNKSRSSIIFVELFCGDESLKAGDMIGER